MITSTTPRLAADEVAGLRALVGFRAAIERQCCADWTACWATLHAVCRRFQAGALNERAVSQLHRCLRAADAAARIFGLEPRDWYDELPLADRDLVQHAVAACKMLLLTFGTRTEKA